MSERRLSKQDGAKLVPNSGRGKYRKGDAELPPFLLDYKEYSKSYSIHIDNWKKLSEDAWEQGHMDPALSLVLDGKTRLAVIDWDMFLDMRDAWLAMNTESDA